MSTTDFLAWSLVAAGTLALLWFVLERYVRKPEVRMTGRVKQATILLALLFYGTILTRDVSRLFFTAQPPAWTSLLSSAVPLVLGLFLLLTLKKGDTDNPVRVFAGILITVGALTLALDGYRYAISLGAAGSISL